MEFQFFLFLVFGRKKKLVNKLNSCVYSCIILNDTFFSDMCYTQITARKANNVTADSPKLKGKVQRLTVGLMYCDSTLLIVLHAELSGIKGTLID